MLDNNNRWTIGIVKHEGFPPATALAATGEDSNDEILAAMHEEIVDTFCIELPIIES